MTRSEEVKGLNLEVLAWARQMAGHSIESVAQSFKKEPAVIEAWESGEAVPTYVQLEKLAYKIYKRPIAIFFFPAPPAEPEPEGFFRTLPGSEFEKLDPDTRYKIRKAYGFRLSLIELHDSTNPADRKIFRDLVFSGETEVEEGVASVRTHLGVSLDDQKEWKDATEALKGWREAFEEVGIYVFKDNFKQDVISGFCLSDDEFPLIMVNNSTSHTRQIFTLIHELAHILWRTSGMTHQDDTYISSLEHSTQTVEVFCNRFAGEFLVPSYDLRKTLEASDVQDGTASLSSVSRLADLYNVSREVILRKFVEQGLFPEATYRETVAAWRDRSKQSERGGGNYYATQAMYLGKKYLQLVFSRYYQGRASLEEVADFLNVKAKNVPGLEEYALK
ncbi:MAG: ImmA/IrrE family metallo-endopeptidase [Truepera sp.]|nr:ImmA/IrrE family metallo-endopeptidase [Truepera sp.]